MMRRYETIFISSPDAPEEARDQVFQKTKDLISQMEGFLVNFDEWGSRKLAYEIKKKNQGYYVCMDYCGNGALVNEIERSFRIDDRVLKYMTILLESQADIDAIKEEMAKAAAAAEDETVIDDESPAPDDKPEADKADLTDTKTDESK
jgi:small subunit ribosomal protein S6